MNHKLLSALSCRNTGRPPIWLMRQAGRYMPEFRAMRQKHSFLELCRHPELAAEVTMLPLQAFDLDAAILFSDILVILEAFDVGLQFKEGVGPVIERPIQDAAAANKLSPRPIREAVACVPQAIRLLKSALSVPLIGFCGAPFTVASYLVEGGSSHDLKKTKQWIFRDPASLQKLLDQIANATLEYLWMQIEAGVDAVQIFDTWAIHLSTAQWKAFSEPYIKRLLDGLRPSGVPVILYSRGSALFASELAALRPACVGVDWQCDLPALSKQLPQGMAIQGNLDPDTLYAPQGVLRREVSSLLKAMEGHPGYIFNLGHGLKPDMSPDAVKTLIDAVHCF